MGLVFATDSYSTKYVGRRWGLLLSLRLAIIEIVSSDRNCGVVGVVGFTTGSPFTLLQGVARPKEWYRLRLVESRPSLRSGAWHLETTRSRVLGLSTQ